MKRPRILKRHAGRPIDFRHAQTPEVLNGRVLTVRNAIAKVHYYPQGSFRSLSSEAPDGFIAYLDVRSDRIVEIY